MSVDEHPGRRRRWQQLRERRHQVLGWAWIALAIPTVVWWKDAIVWVALMSIYANAEASFAAHAADRQQRERENPDRT